MAREIVLDTETTGFDPKTGDRLIEVGCIEIEDLLPTGRTYHTLVNPERLIPPGAIAVHGITDDKVRDAPKFAAVVDDLFKNRDVLDFSDLGLIAIGFVVAFLSALAVVRFLLDFVSKRGFGLFAWWRIVVGVVGLALLQAGF